MKQEKKFTVKEYWISLDVMLSFIFSDNEHAHEDFYSPDKH